jgi:hypothetical protein
MERRGLKLFDNEVLHTIITILELIRLPVFYLKHMVDNFRTSQEAHYVSATSPSS